MSTVRKYAGLPDLDLATDIYETPELIDDNSTHANQTPTTVRSISPASSHGENAGIDRHRLDADEARNRFLPSDQRDQNLAGRISTKRKSYRSASRRRRKDAPNINGVINGVEVSSDDEEESLERKLARIRKEVEEVKSEFERRKEGAGDSKPHPNDESDSIENISQVLEGVGPVTSDVEKTAARRLMKALSSASRTNGAAEDRESKQPTQSNGTGSAFTINYTPHYQEGNTLAKVSDFDSRLALIETALGLGATPLPTQDGSTTRAMIPTLNSLDRQLETLATSTDASLDKLSRRVRHLTVDAEKLERARKAAREADESSDGETQPGGPPEADDHDSMSKINALYGTLPTIESLAPLLPAVLDRLRSLRALHADAAAASQTLSKVESRQQDMKIELQSWTEGLEKVESAMAKGEQTMKGNTETIEGWVKELEERTRKIG
ncbi:hypothetical protein MMC21_000401 [Puttea exsequens]|nr:hypothetical protein [Puttea exsequens]